ncbi:MAG: hypothetical protein GY842_13330 [bacterium]|nr:hypothetical protein [bacterium]
MIRYECDKCGCSLTANDPRRFIVKMEVYAAAAPLEFSQSELAKDHTSEIKELVEQLYTANPDEIEDQTYRRLRFDLCNTCQQALLRRPLG